MQKNLYKREKMVYNYLINKFNNTIAMVKLWIILNSYDQRSGMTKYS